jgi:hypothetical protein
VGRKDKHFGKPVGLATVTDFKRPAHGLRIHGADVLGGSLTYSVLQLHPLNDYEGFYSAACEEVPSPSIWPAALCHDKDDVSTVAAIAILAFISADIAHEVLGHGIGLLIAGGRSGILTTTRLISESQLPNSNWRIFDLAGPAGNLTWAGACFLVQRLLRRAAPRLRLFLWTCMAFSLLWEFGYLLKCAVTGYGDDMAIIWGLRPAWVWRALIFSIGLLLYRAALSVISSELHFILSLKESQWRPRMVRILLTLCSAGGLIACAGAIFDPRGQIEIVKSAALSSFASWVGLFAVPFFFPLHADKKAEPNAPIERSIPLESCCSVRFSPICTGSWAGHPLLAVIASADAVIPVE